MKGLLICWACDSVLISHRAVRGLIDRRWCLCILLCHAAAGWASFRPKGRGIKADMLPNNALWITFVGSKTGMIFYNL